LDADRLAKLHAGLGRLVVRRFFEDLRGDLRRFSFDDVEAVRGMKDGEVRVLPGGIRLEREGAWIGLERRKPRHRVFAYSWNGRSVLSVPEAGIRLRAIRSGSLPNAREFDDASRAFLDAVTLSYPLTVRSRAAGDRYRPLGSPGRRKLNEVLRSRGVEASARDVQTLICSEGEIAWVPGLPVAERFKVTPETRSVIRIEVVRDPLRAPSRGSG
jgi:tRNA(Ile)-lysidine synthase